MPVDITALKREHALSPLVAKYTALTADGDEFRGLCPFHKEKTPSFTVHDGKGFYHCFGCGAHGDVIDFVADIHRVSFMEAVKILAGEQAAGEAYKPAPLAPATVDVYSGLEAQPIDEAEIPAPRQRLRAWNPKRDQWTTYYPSMVFPYRDAAGACIGVVVRIDLGDGRKLTPTLRKARLPKTGEIAWSHLPFDKPRPLYGLDRLAKQAGEVIWCEGEKATDACRRILGRCVVGAPGGGKGVGLVDWTPLKGRPLLIFGDADQEGERTVLGYERQGQHVPGVAELAFKAGAGPIRYVPWDKAKPKGWDAADAEAEGYLAQKLLAWIESRAKKWTAPADKVPSDDLEAQHRRVAAVARAEYAGEPPIPRHERGAVADHPFRILGHTGDTFHYLPHGTQRIIALKAPQHTQPNLLNLAPLSHWENMFPHKTRLFDVLAATDALMRRAEQVGYFDHDRLRGRGAWIDDGRPVVHVGDRVVIDGAAYPPPRAPSKFIYQMGKPIDLALGEPATRDEAQALVRIAERITWESRLSAQLLVGWIVTAMVCGALTWRPHIWIRGPAHAGKTTVVDDIVARCLGALAIRRDGNTSEAHLRQTLGNDALPVIIDEAESEDKLSAQRIQQVLQLARVAASGGIIGKGGQDGQALAYTARAQMCFSSINPSVTHYADDTRITQLAIRRYELADAEAHFADLKRLIATHLTPDFGARLFSRAVNYLPALLQNARIFTDAAATVLKNRRAADQIGTMLAGLYLCYSEGAASYDKAVEWIAERVWTEHTAIDAVNDERRLLMTLALTPVRTQTQAGGARDYTVGELVLFACGDMGDSIITLHEAAVALGRLGIRVSGPKGARAFTVANTSPQLAKLLEGTPWVSNWRGTLRNLPGAEPADPQKFSPGLTARGTTLPVELLTDGEMQK